MTSKVLVVLTVVVCVLQSTRSRTVVSYDNSAKPVPETVPGVHVGTDGVSASFGGYSASAGLGGAVGGSPGATGGLYAKAGTPDGAGASAGLGGSVNSGDQAQGGLYAGTSSGSSGISTTHTVYKPRPAGSSQLYNDIFNIPTSILGAVNRLLNNGANQVLRAGSSGVHAGASVGVGAHPDVGTRVGVDTSAHGGTSTGTTGAVIVSNKETSSGLLNDIFNIPITALNAVNQLLNNKNGK